MEQVTYSQLKTQEWREVVKDDLFTSVGTQSGGFGIFQEHFRTISLNGSNEIKKELKATADLLGVSYDEFMESMPELKRLIK